MKTKLNLIPKPHFHAQLFHAHNSISSNKLRVKTWQIKKFSQASSEPDNPTIESTRAATFICWGAHIKINLLYAWNQPKSDLWGWRRTMLWAGPIRWTLPPLTPGIWSRPAYQGRGQHTVYAWGRWLWIWLQAGQPTKAEGRHSLCIGEVSPDLASRRNKPKLMLLRKCFMVIITLIIYYILKFYVPV